MSDDTEQQILNQVRMLPPLDQTYQISSFNSYVVDYRERKHIYIWLPVTQTLSIEEYGSGSVPGQQWVNIGIRPGVRITAPNVTSGTVTMIVRCTDEQVA